MIYRGERRSWQLESDWIFDILDEAAQGFIELSDGIGLRPG